MLMWIPDVFSCRYSPSTWRLLVCWAFWHASLLTALVKLSAHPSGHFSSDWAHQLCVSSCESAAHWMIFAPFCVNLTDCCVWKSHEISRFWNTQTSLSGTNNSRSHPDTGLLIKSNVILSYISKNKTSPKTMGGITGFSSPDVFHLFHFSIFVSMLAALHHRGEKKFEIRKRA